MNEEVLDIPVHHNHFVKQNEVSIEFMYPESLIFDVFRDGKEGFYAFLAKPSLSGQGYTLLAHNYLGNVLNVNEQRTFIDDCKAMKMYADVNKDEGVIFKLYRNADTQVFKEFYKTNMLHKGISITYYRYGTNVDMTACDPIYM